MKPSMNHLFQITFFAFAFLIGACDNGTQDSAATTSNSSGAPVGQLALSNTAFSLAAKGVDSADSATGLMLNAENGDFSLTDPADPYPGIGVNSGEAVVEGLKIFLTGVRIENQVDQNAANSENKSSVIFDWTTAPKELQIAKGYAGTFNESINTYLKPGDYNRLHVSMLDKLSMKAYAFLDADNNGTIDTTIYTSVAAVKKVAVVLDPMAMPTDYAYYTYGYIGALSANSLTASTASAGTLTVFDKPVTIPKTEIDALVDASATSTATSSTTKNTSTTPTPTPTPPPVNLNVSVVVDTTNLLKAWDGRFGDAVQAPYIRGDGKIPQPEFPFPMDNIPAHGRRHDPGLTQLDFYPGGIPAFGLGNYIPMFAFANVAKAKFQVYAFSLDQNFNTFWKPVNAGAVRKTLILTVALDANGLPLLSRTTSLAESSDLFIGALGRIFEKQSDGTYTFYTNYGVKDAAGKDDGGLYYKSDKTAAGHIFTGFNAGAAVGAEFQVTQKDGPRCKAEYDYCVGTAGKTIYVKRLK